MSAHDQIGLAKEAEECYRAPFTESEGLLLQVCGCGALAFSCGISETVARYQTSRFGLSGLVTQRGDC